MDKPIRDILIFPTDNQYGCQCVLQEDGHAVEWLGRPVSQVEYGISSDSEQVVWQEQDILLAAAARVVPSLDCAFISLGQDKEGMLPLKLAPAGIKAGQKLIVQVRRLTAAGKGCQLTARPQLPGLWTVYRPYEVRNLTRSKLYLLPEADRERFVNDEIGSLELMWQQMQIKTDEPGSLPTLLHRFRDPLQQVLRDWLNENVSTIQIESSELFIRFDELVKKHAPHWRSKLRLHVAGGGYDLADTFGLGDLDDRVRRRSVWLKNGGRCVFDQTEAMMAIDVNSAKASSGGKPDALRHQTNLLAAEEIARQLRLREIQGLVVIDFIRTRNNSDKEKLAMLLDNLWQRDMAKINAGGFTSLGLYELSRSHKK